MPEHELEKLLGGFVADTLTPEERQKLYTGALQDQQLFNVLADEQALKELLADPAVRRRLLQSLNQTSSSGAALSWLNWLRRPAPLGYAGGLAAAVLAVVLGTKVYQESLRQATQSATEEVKPVSPSFSAPQASEPAQAPLTDTKLEEKGKIAPAVPEKPAGDKSRKREKSVVLPSQERQFSGSAEREREPQSEQDQVQKEAPEKTLEKATGDGTTSGSKLKSDSPSKAAAPELELRATAPASSRVASARALFYGEAPGRSDVSMLLQEERAKQH